jgi:putative addiction module CopG family antidote
MARTYTPGQEADAIVERQLAKGCYSSADQVVRVGLQLLQQSEAEIAELARLIEKEAAAYASGDDDTYTAADGPHTDEWTSTTAR